MFYTRIPIPKETAYSDDLLNESRTYFPAIGIIVGSFGALCFLLSAHFLPLSIAIALSMTSTILITGAFHEDGFADSCDGLGGGWSSEQVLIIMKDSRLGTYGCIGLAQLNLFLFCALLIYSHTLSRTCASAIIEYYDYVQDVQQSKVKPITDRRLSSQQKKLSLLITIVPAILLACSNFDLIGSLILSCLLAGFISWSWANYCKRRINGYTGDTLGATQQLSEISIYLVFLM